MHSITVHLSWFTLYKYVCFDSSVCVLIYARVSLSISALDSPSGARDCWSLSVYLVAYFHFSYFIQLCLCIVNLCIQTYVVSVFQTMYFESVLRLYIVVASWTTIYFIFHCELFWYSMSVIGFICSKFITIYCFVLFKSDMCGFIVDLNGPK